MAILKLNGNQWFDGAQRPARERSADQSGTAVPAPLDDGNECVLRVRAAVNEYEFSYDPVHCYSHTIGSSQCQSRARVRIAGR